MYRKYIVDLESWMNNPRKKPLIVWGARQVGKSYLIKELFAEKYFSNNYIYVDCRVESDFRKYVENNLNVNDVLNYLSLSFNKRIDEHTLIIFDEAQECLPIITLLKYFCQEHREIPVIVTGSMVRIKIKRETNKRGTGKENFLFPIGKINQLTIYPLNFEEYLINRNEILYKAIVDSYANKKPLDEMIHERAMKCFNEYLLVGGMPEVVSTFLETESYFEARNILKDLYDNYLSDMTLYQASPESVIRATKVFANIYAQLNKESKNFSPSLLESKSKNRDFISPIDWLSTAFLVHKSSLVKEKVTLPLIESNESLFRLYLADIGMFSYQSGVNATTFIAGADNQLAGIFYENYVAIELVNSGRNLFYWKGKNEAEFEFVIEDNSKIIPLDVKKKKGTLNSIEKFKDHNEFNYVVKISQNKYGYNDDQKILTIPYYCLFMFLKDLQGDEFKNLNL